MFNVYESIIIVTFIINFLCSLFVLFYTFYNDKVSLEKTFQGKRGCPLFLVVYMPLPLMSKPLKTC